MINLRGDIVKRKKELLAELANMESLEEPVFRVGVLYARKSYVEEQLLHIYEEEERI